MILHQEYAVYRQKIVDLYKGKFGWKAKKTTEQFFLQ
jgi:hypothetical protein